MMSFFFLCVWVSPRSQAPCLKTTEHFFEKKIVHISSHAVVYYRNDIFLLALVGVMNVQLYQIDADAPWRKQRFGLLLFSLNNCLDYYYFYFYFRGSSVPLSVLCGQNSVEYSVQSLSQQCSIIMYEIIALVAVRRLGSNWAATDRRRSSTAHPHRNVLSLRLTCARPIEPIHIFLFFSLTKKKKREKEIMHNHCSQTLYFFYFNFFELVNLLRASPFLFSSFLNSFFVFFCFFCFYQCERFDSAICHCRFSTVYKEFSLPVAYRLSFKPQVIIPGFKKNNFFFFYFCKFL